MAELKYFDAGSGTWKSISVSTPPEVYVGIDPPAPRDQQLLWVDPDESPPAIARDITMDSWHLVGAAGEPAFQNSWVNYGAPEALAGFRKYPDGRVRLKGLIKSGTANAAFTLPVGYRPPTNTYFPISTNNGAGTVYGNVTIGSDGTVGMSQIAGVWASLADIEFDTESVSSVTSVVAQPMEPWHTVGATGEPAFQNSWVAGASGPVTAFRKDPLGRVHIKGNVQNGTSASAVFTLPAGYRPPSNRYFVVLGAGGAAGNYINITAAGDVVCTRTGADIHIGDIEFDTETVNNWTPASLPPNIIPLDQWHIVNNPGEPAFQNGWVHYDSRVARFRKYDDGRVRLEGIIKSGTVATAAFTLPVGYRPTAAAELYFSCVSNAVFCQVNIAPNGNVVVGSTFSVWLDLSGIEFDAGSSALGVTSSVAQPMDTWHLVGGSGEPPFSAGWTQYAGGEPIGFRKYPDGRVRLKGIANGATPTSTAFALPAGYRPPLAQRFACVSGGGPANVQANTDGTIQWVSSTNFYNAASYIDFSAIEFDTQTVSAYTVGAIPSPRMPVVSSLPTSPAPVAGDMVLMMPSNIPYYYDGTAWKAWVGSGGGGGGTGAFAFFMGDD